MNTDLLSSAGEQSQISAALDKWEHAGKEFNRRNFHLRVLYDVGYKLSPLRDTGEMLDTTLAIVLDTFKIQTGLVLFYEIGTRGVRIASNVGFSEKDAGALRSGGIHSYFDGLNTEQPFHLLGVWDCQNLPMNPDTLVSLGAQLWIPFTLGDGMMGAVILGRKTSGEPYYTDNMELLSLIFLNVMVHLENVLLYQKQCAARHRLDTVLEIAQEITSVLELDTLLDRIMEETTKALKAERSSLYLVDKERNALWTKVAQGLGNVITLPIGMGISGRVAQTGETLNIPDAWECPYFDKETDIQNRFRTKSVLCMPIRTRLREIIGVVQVINKREGPFIVEDEVLLSGIASHAAIALENAQLREEALRKERLAAIGQTIAGLAHCIKNIQNGIHGGSYILERGLDRGDFDRLSRGWEMVKRNNAFMHELVLDMLTYAKDRQPETAPTDLNALCQSVCELTTEKARMNDVEIVCTLDAGLGEVIVDPKGIRRCLMNLVSNAVDACGEKGGRVELSTKREDDPGRFCVVISDNGSGISKENQARLFQMFFSTKGSKGTGLGLAVTHKIIQEHGGALTVESEPGAGSRFIINLPTRGVPSPQSDGRTDQTQTTQQNEGGTNG